MLAEEKRYAKQPSRPLRKRQTARRVQRSGKVLICLQITAVILSCFGFGLFYIYKNNHITALGYSVEENKQRVDALQRDCKQLELEAAELQSPERVEEAAVNKLGMDKPDGVLLAALPAEEDNDQDKQNASGDESKEKKKSWSMALKQLIGRAEASTQ